MGNMRCLNEGCGYILQTHYISYDQDITMRDEDDDRKGISRVSYDDYNPMLSNGGFGLYYSLTPQESR